MVEVRRPPLDAPVERDLRAAFSCAWVGRRRGLPTPIDPRRSEKTTVRRGKSRRSPGVRKPISLPNNEDQWKIYFDILKQFEITTELEIKTDKLYTPGGYMRVKIPKTKNNIPKYFTTIFLLISSTIAPTR